MQDSFLAPTYPNGDLFREAYFDPDPQWRYTLHRIWQYGQPLCNFILLNPSTADAMADDPTMRRCRTFAKATGHGGMIVTNLFALRSTDPHGLYTHPAPEGPQNNSMILVAASSTSQSRGGLVICGWGVHGDLHDRDWEITTILRGHDIPLYCLGVTKDGFPKHPLYLASSTRPIRFTPRERP